MDWLTKYLPDVLVFFWSPIVAPFSDRLYRWRPRQTSVRGTHRAVRRLYSGGIFGRQPAGPDH
jgi:hypothetical protein